MNWLDRILSLGLPCVFQALTGLYCPGCGGTRAVRALFKGDLRMSVQYHPLVLYAVLAFFGELLLRHVPGIGKNPGAGEKRIRIWILIGAILVVVNWIFKNYMLVARGVDLLPLMK